MESAIIYLFAAVGAWSIGRRLAGLARRSSAGPEALRKCKPVATYLAQGVAVDGLRLQLVSKGGRHTVIPVGADGSQSPRHTQRAFTSYSELASHCRETHQQSADLEGFVRAALRDLEIGRVA
jgi:hypothetical protein